MLQTVHIQLYNSLKPIHKEIKTFHLRSKKARKAQVAFRSNDSSSSLIIKQFKNKETWNCINLNTSMVYDL